MKVKIINSTLVYAVTEPEQTLDLNVQLIETSGNSNKFNPAMPNGSSKSSGAYRGYYVDLTGLYAQGYRKVKFKAAKNDTAVCLGLVATSAIPGTRSGTDTIESSVPSTTNSLAFDWFELPITANSKCLHATYCYSSQYAAGVEVKTPSNGDAKASNRSVSE